MISDTNNTFCAATALSTQAAGGTSVLGNVMDLGANGTNLGLDTDLYLIIQASESATSGGAATAEFQLVSDAQPALATDGSATIHFTTGPVSLAKLAAGKRVAMIELPGGSYERYLGLLQTTGTAAFTGGKIHAFLTMDKSGWRALSDGI